jgi:hypothetical protein
MKHCHTLTLDTARVLFPARVTVWILEAAILKVIVAPSVSAVIVLTNPFRVGLVQNTRLQVPVSSVIAVAKLALEGVAKNVATHVPSPLTHVEIGSHVQLVRVQDVGVQRVGVVSVGLVRVLFVSVSVLEIVTTLTHSTAIRHADTREIVVSVACHTSTLQTVIAFVVP